MFNRNNVYRINDDELPNGKFNLHIPKTKTFAQQSKFLDNDITEEIPDEAELNYNIKPKKNTATSVVKSFIETG